MASKGRTKKSVPNTEEVNYGKSLKLAEEIIKPASQSSCPPRTELHEQKDLMFDKKKYKSSRTTIRPTKIRDKGKWEESNKKQIKAEAGVSKDAQEIPTCDTGISPTKCSTPQSIQRNRRASADKTLNPPAWKEETVCDVSPGDDQQSKSSVLRRRLKSSTNTDKELESLTITEKIRGQKGTKQRPVQRKVRFPKKTQRTDADLQAESSETDTEQGNGLQVHKNLKHHMPDFEEDKGLSSSELSLEMTSPECTDVHGVSPPHDDTEEDIQLPIVILQKEPTTITPGSFVWCKFQRYPYWPSLVKLVYSKMKKVSIIFIVESISDPTKKPESFKVALGSIKNYDCPEKQQFLADARKDYGKSIDWCDALISDYRIRLGCGSFSGSFIDYCTADISLPVRRELANGKTEVIFPVVSSEVAEAQEEVTSSKSKNNRKLLPDRARAARDRANEKLVEFIVNAKEAENHLLDILSGNKKSQWLKRFQSSNRRLNCLETYIEDEDQIELMVGYLQTLCKKMSSATKMLTLGDHTQFIFEVLIPEAVIFAIAATEKVSYEEAEQKYRKGPSITKR
ncbi:hypothetical protein GDO81_001230 [Engystomops pustulosus]|nr:hypothetical protein GDO81_001230 [Engystomops pustulosus]KAG8594519.1 hypothetical protein GDO81_001230 [Engystomops pustulosus]